MKTKGPKNGAKPSAGFAVQQVLFCYESDDPKQVLELMGQHGIDAIPVVDDEQRLVGVFQRHRK